MDESAVPPRTPDPLSDTEEGDDGVPYYDDEPDMPTGQVDPLGLETNDSQQDDDVLSIFPRDSESFLGDAEFLPNVTKQECGLGGHHDSSQ